jgi:uncharacterized membrane protein
VFDAEGRRHGAEWRHGMLRVVPDEGYPEANVADVNDRGQLLGVFVDAGGAPVPWVWNGRSFTYLSMPAGTEFVQVRRLNARGDVVGTVQYPGDDGLLFAVRWDAPRYRPHLLPPAPGDAGSFGHGINDRGTAAGASDRGDNSPHVPVLWNRRGRVEALPTIGGPAEAWVVNNAGQVAGYGYARYGDDPGNVSHAVFWDVRHRVHDLGYLPHAIDTLAFGISQNGWVVGASVTRPDPESAATASYGWVWHNSGPLRALPIPAGRQSIAFDVIENGLVVGNVAGDLDELSTSRAAVWQCRR